MWCFLGSWSRDEVETVAEGLNNVADEYSKIIDYNNYLCFVLQNKSIQAAYLKAAVIKQ